MSGHIVHVYHLNSMLNHCISVTRYSSTHVGGCVGSKPQTTGHQHMVHCTHMVNSPKLVNWLWVRLKRKKIFPYFFILLYRHLKGGSYTGLNRFKQKDECPMIYFVSNHSPYHPIWFQPSYLCLLLSHCPCCCFHYSKGFNTFIFFQLLGLIACCDLTCFLCLYKLRCVNVWVTVNDPPKLQEDSLLFLEGEDSVCFYTCPWSPFTMDLWATIKDFFFFFFLNKTDHPSPTWPFIIKTTFSSFLSVSAMVTIWIVFNCVPINWNFGT